MRLERLEIQALPGIEPGFHLDAVDPGINLITGPNAVGKSSLIRAFRYLVGEARSDDPRALALTAVFQGADGRWTVRRTGREIVWEKEGRPAERPPLPERDQLYCYLLSMEDLLQADKRDDRLIAELRRALSGGYDMDALRKEMPFRLGARHGENEARGLLNAEKHLREVEATYKTLQRDEGKIPSLEKNIEEARKAAERVERLKQALDLLETCGERRKVEAGLNEFPENMDRLRGDEIERLKRFDNRRENLDNELETQAGALEEAERLLQETGLGGGRPESTDLQARARDLEQARRKADQRDQKQDDLEEAATAEEQALGYLGGDQAVPRLDPDSVSRAETLASQLQIAQRKQQELQDRLEEAGQAPDQASIDRHFQATEALHAWLAGQGGISGRQRVAILVAGAGGLVAAVMAILAQVWLAVLGGGIASVGALWALFESRVADNVASRRRFEHCGIEGPENWRREAVEARLQAIDAKRSELQQQALRAQQAEDVRQKLTRVGQELEILQQEKAAMAEQLGFDPGLTAAALDRFVRLVQDYERAHNKHETAKVAIKRLDGDVKTLTGQVLRFLDCWQAAPREDEGLDALEIGLDGLRRRGEQAESAERKAREAKRERSRIKKDLAALDAEEATLFVETEMEPGKRTELTRCCEQFDAWRDRQEELRNARVREAERRRTIEGEQDLLDRVEADDREGLKSELEQAEEQASGREKLQRDLTAIRTRLQDAGKDHQLEKAMAKVDAARAVLEDKHHEALFAAASGLLLDGVQQEHHSEHEPEVLRDARDRFRRFTHHAFEFELDEEGGFIAHDLEQQARRSLSELSSATRMQLLLAMRVAWTRRLEKGRETLPLFLDEALTTSDEQRFSQVAESLEQLVRDEGLQVFYLSSRRHEIVLWERATGNSPHHIDLAAVRFGRIDAAPDDFVLPEIESLPLPGEHSPESYAAALGVPPVDPRRPEGKIHLYYLLRDDLHLLHHLMEDWRISTLGQLEGLLRSSSAGDVIPDANCRKCLEGRCAAARVWVAIWCQGRGKPLDRIALESSGAVTGIFLKRVSELADSLSGDADAVISALKDGEVSGFGPKKTEKLAGWLETEGYIAPDEILSSEDRERCTLLNAAKHAAPEEIRQVVRWLEAGQQGTGS
jgi:uncharacterized protein YhaN